MASGDLLLSIYPEEYSPTLTNPATPDSRLTGSDQHPVLDYDPTTNESAIWRAIMPPNYSGGNVNFALWGAMSSATSGNIVVSVAFERTNGQDLDVSGFASAQVFSAVAVPANNGDLFVITGAVTAGANMDSVTANDPYRLAINREATNGSDTASGDWEFWGGTIREA